MQEEAKGKYEDMLDLPRPASARHAPMPLKARAAQFSPFAALTGYDEMILETEMSVREPKADGPDHGSGSVNDSHFS